MRVRPGRLIVGVLLFGNAVLMAGTHPNPLVRRLASLALLGGLMGAFGHVWFRRSRAMSVDWKRLSNGGWLGSAVLPATVSLAVLTPVAAVQSFLIGGVFGVFVGYGLGLIASGLGYLPTSPLPDDG